jgi:AAA family ATP:ADP antiporter
MVENWVFSLFFCAGELWGGVVISVLFWTLANEVCSVSDAKTIYPLMGIAANIALVVAGNYMKWVNNTLTQVPTHDTHALWGFTWLRGSQVPCYMI